MYRSITTPVLIAWGEEDEWIPIERGRELHAAIPGSTVAPIAAAGHLVQEDKPNVLLKNIGEFLV